MLARSSARRSALRRSTKASARQGPARPRLRRLDGRFRHLRAPGSGLRRDRPGLTPQSRGRPGHGHQLRQLARRPGQPRLWTRSTIPGTSSPTVHVNGGFRGLPEVRLAKFKGLPRRTFHLHLEATGWRYNHADRCQMPPAKSAQLGKTLLKYDVKRDRPARFPQAENPNPLARRAGRRPHRRRRPSSPSPHHASGTWPGSPPRNAGAPAFATPPPVAARVRTRETPRTSRPGTDPAKEISRRRSPDISP